MAYILTIFRIHESTQLPFHLRYPFSNRKQLQIQVYISEQKAHVLWSFIELSLNKHGVTSLS